MLRLPLPLGKACLGLWGRTQKQGIPKFKGALHSNQSPFTGTESGPVVVSRWEAGGGGDMFGGTGFVLKPPKLAEKTLKLDMVMAVCLREYTKTTQLYTFAMVILWHVTDVSIKANPSKMLRFFGMCVHVHTHTHTLTLHETYLD